MAGAPHIEVRDLTAAYGDRIIQQGLTFSVQRGEVFIIMGGSGSGKSTVLRHLIGLQAPATGEVFIEQRKFSHASHGQQETIKRRFGVLFQSGALFSSLTLAENVATPLNENTQLSVAEIRDVVDYKLALVGLSGCQELYPAEISGGMRKRAGLARAMALDPELLFFDEPSAGLDPVNSRRLDELILELRANLGTTIVVVTHELASIFAIGDNSIFLDAEAKTMIASGNPKQLQRACDDARVHAFLNRENV
ncbi:polyamine ABC transporter ATP-binding protein [Candidatus Tenderia electrophaga]|jgi:phospholipid/cholesterol/gamma-HCH transport system ATP-binding protein|uniref:Polyamine ABC transporter ATP-binding protein n=1 Tax=Candidatus Tenderia electrophaga TaxID=1748243 RepID=A0A0S2TBN8_9GAMM|nr:polyamine ABC transporter ATP-binding protein [Candidatus Tenderia electrophaga]